MSHRDNYAQRALVRSMISLFLMLGLTFQVAWSVPQQEQELMKPPQYKIDVVLKLITVYVTDKKGQPVEDLTLEDFTATDNGQPVKLTQFEKHILKVPVEKAIVPVTRVAPVMPRKFFLFFDFAYNNAQGLNQARKAAQHFLETVVRPDDEVSVLSYSMTRGITFHEYLTRDKAKVRQVIDSIGGKNIVGRADEIEQKYWILAQESPSSMKARADEMNLEAERREAKRIAETYILRLTVLAKALRLEPGQKHFIFFSTGVPSSMIYGGKGKDSIRQNLFISTTIFDTGDSELREKNEAMYRELAAANCNVYTFDTRQAAMVADVFAYDRITFEEQDPYTGRGMFTETGFSKDSTNLYRDEKTLGGDTLKRLADLTGGKYFSSINEYKKNLNQVQALTGAYYVLGYSIGESEDGQFHEIKVEVKRPGYQVRSQSGYFNPKPFRDYTDLEKKMHLFELALNERSFSRLPVNFPVSCLSLATAEGSGLKIVARIPGEVTAKFEGKSVEYVILIFDKKNDVKDLRRLEVEPGLYRGRPVIFTSALPVEPGEYICRLVIRDLESGLGAANSVRISVPMATQSGLRLGTPLLLQEEGGCAYLETATKEGQPALLWAEIYPFDKTSLVPVAGQVSGHTSHLQVLVPYNVPGMNEPEVVLSVRLVEAASAQARPVTASLVETVHHSRGETAVLEIQLPPLKSGVYLLYVDGVDHLSRTAAHNMTAFSITED
ncbi:MAG: VWA domain-containing protein [Acidobacteriota bacterium]|nr:VWA domain-containing protein [Acidobacteriota bacterium]